MTTLAENYLNALLADAAYATPLRDGMPANDLRDALSDRMTPTLAKLISDNFSVVSHIESDDAAGSGFDGTVWRGNTGTSFAGQVYVSMQGTEGANDFAADFDLVASGAARAQWVEMVNW